MDKITVLMAVYNPREDWFIKQLKSIDDQTYPNVELIICDDCSPEITLKDLHHIVERCMQKIPYRIYCNQSNLGSTKTFERLTAENTGDYFAYCDQDDIWDCNKLYKGWTVLTSGNGCMVCTNADAIDADGFLISKGFMSIPQGFQKQIANGDAWKTLLTKNYFWGCTMLIKAEVAKKSLPFLSKMYHDHYLELYAAMNGKIMFIEESLMKYRIHGNNQTGFLKDIYNKEGYYNKRICPLAVRYKELLNRDVKDEYITTISNMLTWAESRERYAKGEWISCLGMLKGIRFNIATTMFELLIMPLPESLWNSILVKMKKVKSLRCKKKQG